MSLTKTPICDFGKKAENFQLNSTDNKVISLYDVKGVATNIPKKGKAKS